MGSAVLRRETRVGAFCCVSACGNSCSSPSVLSGFFYTIFINAHKTDPAVVSLDAKVDPDGFAILLEFMYTSCLTLTERFIVATLNTAIYLQMEHMVETCQRFMESR